MWSRTLSAVLALATAALASPVNTATWSGAEFTPSRAPGNSLWWARYGEYARDVDIELGFLATRFGFNTMRMFLHAAVFDLDGGASLWSAMDAFLHVASSHGISTGFVFFDDCWAPDCSGWQPGAPTCNVTLPCTPTKGRHNGCWTQSPFVPDRTNVTRFLPYVQGTVARFAADPRVRYWEVYNEPRQGDAFSMALRQAGYDAAVAAHPSQPVLSCWDDNNATQAVDVHHYDTNFPGLTAQVFSNPSKGGVITEGGSRWFQGYPSDAGSPKTFVTWHNNLQASASPPPGAFPFGMLINWEGMVGGSNTRWHWNTPDGSPEPVIPWDAHVFPDGTPVSYTEAALVRNWTLGRSDFLGYAGFLPTEWDFVGDAFLSLPSGSGWTLGVDAIPTGGGPHRSTAGGGPSPGFLAPPPGTLTNFLVEATVWPSNTTGGGIVLRSGVGATGALMGYFVGFRGTNGAGPLLVAEAWGVDGSVLPLASFPMASLDCGLALDGWNMLRATISGAPPTTFLTVWANPMYNESLAVRGILGAPRIALTLPSTAPSFPSGNVALVAVSDDVPADAAPARASAPGASVGVSLSLGSHGLDTAGPGKMEWKAHVRPLAAGDPPIVPPGTAAFDYVSVLPASML